MGPAKPCTAPKPGVGQRQPAEQAGYRHVLTRGGVVPVLEGDAQRPGGAADSLRADRIRDRIRRGEQRYGSMSWVSASRPVLAVTAGGRS